MFMSIFGSDTVHVHSPIAEEAMVGVAVQRFYRLDVKELTDQQYDDLVDHLVQEFGGESEDAERYLQNDGLPIIAHDTVVTIKHPQKWLD